MLYINEIFLNLCYFFSLQEIIEMMHSSGIEVDLVSYGLLALSCTNKNDAEEFFDVLTNKNIT